MTVKVRIWSVFNRDERLALALSDEPGVFNFTRLPDEKADIVECPFATLQCYVFPHRPFPYRDESGGLKTRSAIVSAFTKFSGAVRGHFQKHLGGLVVLL